ncbi:MAG: class I SAM-dependent methyltransferase [Desulfobacterota bacterium]|nr:class I SAM-dependent methyltransferase [Thermodesulfobacteriota bacterium]
MGYQQIEASVRSCYATWGETYYENYYGGQAPYPPVHRDILKNVLYEAQAITVLDAGCGPASFLRELFGTGMDLYGFDLTPEMVAEAQRVFKQNGLQPERVWQGSVFDQKAFRPPWRRRKKLFDAVVCCGVFPHIPKEADALVLANLRSAVKKDGLVAVEARNQLFALFTLNRYSHDFFLRELVKQDELEQQAEEYVHAVREACNDLARHFRMDLPPLRKGMQGEPGYDEVLSRTHNPLVLREQFLSAGFRDIRVLFYHYHCLPPMFESRIPEFFRSQSLAMEDPSDWRGYFMASAFIMTGRKT